MPRPTSAVKDSGIKYLLCYSLYTKKMTTLFSGYSIGRRLPAGPKLTGSVHEENKILCAKFGITPAISGGAMGNLPEVRFSPWENIAFTQNLKLSCCRH